jgi:hypothetical protein
MEALSNERLFHWVRWRRADAMKREKLTTYKIHYVNYWVGRNVDNGFLRHGQLLHNTLSSIVLYGYSRGRGRSSP